MRKGIGGHHHPVRGRTNDWLTPRSIIDALGRFDLDPCCPPGMPWKTAAEHYVDGEIDGLTAAWRGRVWLNPPYGEQLIHWLCRLARHGNGIALVFARTETQAFFKAVWGHADAMLFLRGRVTFCTLDGKGSKAGHNSGGPSVLIAYGPQNVRRLRDCGLKGAFVREEATHA